MAIGAGSVVKGITYHSEKSAHSIGKKIIGGFINPDMDRVARLDPEIIFYEDLHKDAIQRFVGRAILVQLTANSIAESFDQITLLGRIFNSDDEAARIIKEQKLQLANIARKTAKIPADKRKRILRLMDNETAMAPGDDSFQNELIRVAGGVAPEFGNSGHFTYVSLQEWQKFNPQVIYSCSEHRKAITILDQPGWKDVDAVRNRQVFLFPCYQINRVATHSGHFVSWLAARVYREQFSDKGNYILPQQVVARKPLNVDVGYVRKAEIIESDIKDFRNKTVALYLKKPMKVVSTLDGQVDNISIIANNYYPQPSWGLGYKEGLKGLRKNTQATLGFDPDSTAMLITGANMDNLTVIKKSFKRMEVTALVTAGVESNAIRMSADTGNYYEPKIADGNEKPGTINILLMSNMRLTPRAMTRAIISATEGKTAALQDLDVRSTYTYANNQATGTGTDNIIVLEGEGELINTSGGHSKMGELMARAVYDGVQKAVSLQNGIFTKRSVFQRLKDRQISLYAFSRRFVGDADAFVLSSIVERLLLEPEYESFMTAIMAISDDYERGLVTDTQALDLWSRSIASKVAGVSVEPTDIEVDGIPKVVAKGLGALFSGAQVKMVTP